MNVHQRTVSSLQSPQYMGQGRKVDSSQELPAHVPLPNVGKGDAAYCHEYGEGPYRNSRDQGAWEHSGSQFQQRIAMGTSSLARHPKDAYSNVPGNVTGQGNVWSSPFGQSGLGSQESCGQYNGEASTTGFPSDAKKENNVHQQVMNMVLHSVAENLSSQAATQVSTLQKRFPSSVASLRPYFGVSHEYVSRRLRQLIFPFLSLFRLSDARAAAVASDISKFDSSSTFSTCPRDLYIPLMALTTFVLLVGVSRGAVGTFHPEVLGSTGSVSIALLLGEVTILKALLYATGASSVSFLDLMCFCGYKFVHLALLLLLRLTLGLLPVPYLKFPLHKNGSLQGNERFALDLSDSDVGVARMKDIDTGSALDSEASGRLVFCIVFIYLAMCAAFELFALLKTAKAARNDNNGGWMPNGGAGAGASYVITGAAALQIPLCWFLTPCKIFSV